MTSVLLSRHDRKRRRMPEFALVIGLSLGGLIVSLALAFATWPDTPVVFGP